MLAITSFLLLNCVHSADLCSSSDFPFIFGAADATTTVTCLTGLSSSMNPLVVAGSTNSETFSTTGAPYPFLVYVDPTTGTTGVYNEFLTSATAGYTTFQACAGNEEKTSEGAVLATDDPFTLYFIDETTSIFEVGLKNSALEHQETLVVKDIYYKEALALVLVE